MARYTPPPLGPYEYHEVLSAIRKDIKLNRPEDAIYWANVLLTHGGTSAQATLAKQLWIMSAEDIDDPQIVIRAFIVLQMAGKVPETDQLLYLVYAMCKARKWWEHEEGREVDRLWAKAIGDLKIAERNKVVPSYALDRHTRRGWVILKETGEFDDRFSGTELGRQKTVYLYQRDGRIGPESRVDALPTGEPDDGFVEFWKERRRYQAISRNECEPNDPTRDDLALDDEIGQPADALFDVESRGEFGH